MSSRSATQSASGSVRGSIKFAGEEAKDRMYEPKHKKKVVRVLTVVAYVFSVSLAAIMLSMYYIFIWQGTKAQHPNNALHTADCRPAAAGGEVHKPQLPQLPTVFNESLVAETPRVLPAQEIVPIPTTPMSDELPSLYTEKTNQSYADPVHS